MVVSMRIAFPLLAFLGFSQSAWASRSGLNNVPDTDVSASGTGVVQLYSNFGSDRNATFLSGIRLGLEPWGQKMEIGLDSRWEPDEPSYAFFNAKWRFDLDDSGDALALGFANAAPTSHDREITGQPQGYLAGTLNLGWLRIHVGGALQCHNNSLFAGFDHTWQPWGTKLKLRSDITTINNCQDTLASAGFTWRVHEHVNLELWESFPSTTGADPYTTAKIGFHFSF